VVQSGDSLRRFVALANTYHRLPGQLVVDVALEDCAAVVHDLEREHRGNDCQAHGDERSNHCAPRHRGVRDQGAADLRDRRGDSRGRERPAISPAVLLRLQLLDAELKRLTTREREIFDLTVRGLSCESIGLQLSISKRTVDTHRSRILVKLRVHSAMELVQLANRMGLLEASIVVR
jgi:DNA-binding CsgD family transcriptional regulator